MTSRSKLSDLRARDAENPPFQAAYAEARLRFTQYEAVRLSAELKAVPEAAPTADPRGSDA